MKPTPPEILHALADGKIVDTETRDRFIYDRGLNELRQLNVDEWVKSYFSIDQVALWATRIIEPEPNLLSVEEMQEMFDERKPRNQAAIALIQSWLDDTSNYDSETYAKLEKAMTRPESTREVEPTKVVLERLKERVLEPGYHHRADLLDAINAELEKL